MSIFLYSIALHCSCHLSDTALRFFPYLYLCISELRSFDLKIELASLLCIDIRKVEFRNQMPRI